MNLLKGIVVYLLFAVTSAGVLKAADNKYSYLYKKLPFQMNEVPLPAFPALSVSLKDFGGMGDGTTLNSAPFEKAISFLSEKGGGHLNVPSGVWLTGPIVFKSNIDLHLEKGAIIVFSPNFDLYPLVNTIFEGLDTRRCQSPISGRNLTNVAITGEGSINGSGHAWRPLKRAKVTDEQWKSITKSGGIVKEKNYWFPSEKSYKGQQKSDMNVPKGNLSEQEWLDVKDFLRPVMVSFMECKNVLLQGVLFENSPSWNLHPLLCENVIIDNVFARNPAYAQNGDGLDLESCKNVLIVNSTFDVGDDGICIKSGKDEVGRKRARATENVIVDNCRVFQGHGGFVVGSEMSGGVRNISVSNCQFLGTDVGLRFKSCRGRGGVVENIYVSNINMSDITTDSFLFDLYYGGKSASESLSDTVKVSAEEQNVPVSDETPCFRNIFVKNIVSKNARRAMFFNGLPEMNISNVVLENGSFTSRYGAEIVESDGIVFKNVSVKPNEGAAFKLNNVKNFKASKISFPANLAKPIEITGDKTRNIRFPSNMETRNQVSVSSEVKYDNIVYK